MDKIDIINDLRLSPWYLNNVDFFTTIDFGSNYKEQYNKLISDNKNNPDSIYFINSSQDIYFGSFLTNLAFFIALKLF
jgi:hypothetical protein